MIDAENLNDVSITKYLRNAIVPVKSYANFRSLPYCIAITQLRMVTQKSTFSNNAIDCARGR
jgi:hypothetical protein